MTQEVNAWRKMRGDAVRHKGRPARMANLGAPASACPATASATGSRAAEPP